MDSWRQKNSYETVAEFKLYMGQPVYEPLLVRNIIAELFNSMHARPESQTVQTGDLMLERDSIDGEPVLWVRVGTRDEIIL